jgi:integrase/recombinase XerD
MNESEAMDVFNGMYEDSPASVKNYKSATRRFIQHYPDVYEVTTDDIRDYLHSMMEDGYGDKTVDSARTGILKFYQQLDIEDNPADSGRLNIWNWYEYSGKTRKEKESTISYLSSDEIGELVEHLPPPVLRNELIVRLMFETGMRASELCNLKLGDIDTDKREVQIRGGKGNKDRTVWYTDGLDNLLELWLVDRQSVMKESPYLFPTNRSQHITVSSLSDIIHKGAEQAGIQETLYVDKAGKNRNRVTPHTLRHSFAMHSLDAGMPTRYVQKLMGHDKIETTEVYLDALDTDVHDAFKRWGPRS